MKNFLVKNKNIFLVIGLIAILALLLFVLRQATEIPPADIVSVSPVPGAEDVPLEVTARVVFDREVTSEEVVVSVDPFVPFELESPLERKSIIINFQEELNPETTYIVTVSGPNIYKYSWQFKTKEATIPESEVEGRGDPEFSEAEQRYYEENPLLRITPVLTQDYKIVRTGKKAARIYLYAEDKEFARQKVLQWFAEHNINSEDITIEWIE
ncbi:MAG: Ig-like domain-containing protein [Patescibacteria group bacterium]|nr:Ig-like domain-containing protein [Patescibacteria group bacterium]